MTTLGTKRIGDVAEIIRGVSYKKSQAASEPGPGYVPLLRATNISNVLDFENLVYVPDQVVKPEQRLIRGDIVLAASSGSLSVVGKAARLKTSWEGTFGAFCYCVRPDESEVRSRYLELFMQTSDYRRKVSQLAAGTNINNLKREHIASFEIPAIGVEEQDSVIAEIETQLTRVDAVGETLEHTRRMTVRLRQSLLRKAFSHE